MLICIILLTTLSFQLFLLQELIKTLEHASECAIKWFTYNSMIVNPGKFQSIIKESSNGKVNPQSLKIKNNSIETSESVKLLDTEFDNHLKLQSHVPKVCKKAAEQLNDLCHLKSVLSQDQRNIIANSFIYSNFNYYPLVWNFCSQKSIDKIENIPKRTLRFVFNDTLATVKHC